MDSWRLDGIAGPHDLAVAPAPLAATGAGDRTWALFVAEAAKDADNHVHKLLVLHPSALPLSLCCAQAWPCPPVSPSASTAPRACVTLRVTSTEEPNQDAQHGIAMGLRPR